MSRSSNDWAGQVVSQGRYLVRAQLGEGGMGFVYRALDRNLDADVVIKVPRRAMLEDPEFATRFAREIRSLVKLAHPSIVKVTDVGEHDGVPFAVMQYLSGGSLEDYATADRAGAALGSRLAALADWLPGVAAALDFVHSQGYVHRDVKPGNILFDAHGHAFLSDFGVAKALAAETEGASKSKKNQTAVTGAGMVLGTPEYMAPELIMGTPFDGRIDQYALAATVFEMLAGRRPFEANSPTACMVMQTTQPPPALCQVEPRVSRGLSDAVSRALAKDSAHRYPSCAAFASAVLAAGAGPSAEAHKTPSGKAARPDQFRLQCPSCAKSLVFPASLLSDPEKIRGKRLSCPSCQTHLRVSDDGGSLVPSTPGSTTAFHTQIPQGTQKLAPPPHAHPPRSATVPVARPVSSPTVRHTPPTPPGPAERPATLVHPSPSPAQASAAVAPKKTVPNWAIALGVLGGIMAAAVFVAVVVVPAWSGPKTGKVLVDTTAVPEGAAYLLDGRRADPGRFKDFLVLDAGAHELAVTKDGFDPYTLRFPVSAGEESGFKVRLAAQPPPPKAAAEPSRKADVAERKPAPEAPREPPPPPPVASVVRSPQRPSPFPPFQASRVERPAPASGAFKPVPDGPPVDKEPLSTLLQKPESLGDRVVVPTGLYVLGPIWPASQDGMATTTVTRSVLHVRGNALAFLERVESPVTVQVDPDLVEHLRPLADPGFRTYRDKIAGRWTDTAAVLTFHVQKRADSEADVWVPVLKKVEFLVGMKFPRIGEGNFKDAFTTITVTSAAAPSQAISDRHDWKARLGVPYTTALKRYVHNIKDMKFYQDMQAINNAMAPAFNNLMRNSGSPAEALDARMRRVR